MWLVAAFNLLGDPLPSGDYCCFSGSVPGPSVSFCGLFLIDLIHTPSSVSRPPPSPEHQTWTSTSSRISIGDVCLDILLVFSVSMLQLELVSLLNQLLSVTEFIGNHPRCLLSVRQIPKSSVSLQQNLNWPSILSSSSPSSTPLSQQSS